jgi:hypothetical protein
MKIKSRYNFSEFTRFFPQGLNPLKFIENSNMNLFKELNHDMQWEFEVGPMEKVVHHVQI